MAMTPEERAAAREARKAEKLSNHRRFPFAMIGDRTEYAAVLELPEGNGAYMYMITLVDPKEEHEKRQDGTWEIAKLNGEAEKSLESIRNLVQACEPRISST